MSQPRKILTQQDELFRARLSTQLNPKHPLYLLTHVIDWKTLEDEFAPLYKAELGHPPLPIRLMVGLLMLQHLEGLSDEQIVHKWVENPYFQYFCGYDHFQWRLPLDPSSLTRFRQRIGKEGCEKILSSTIKTSVGCKMVKEESFEQVIVDTTAMEKAIAYPTDSKLLHKARQKLVQLAKKQNVFLRQSYTRVGKQAFIMAGRYAHAQQFKRMRGSIKKLKTYLGRVIRDIERKVSDEKRAAFTPLLDMSKRLLSQTKHSTHKLYSLHAPEVECIAKGKAHKKYEFGCKTSLVLTHKEGLALSSQALHDNPYDGHTLTAALEHTHQMTGRKVRGAFVDKGYKGHDVKDCTVFLSGQRKLPAALKRALKRRSAIEPHIGHMKNDGKLGRNYLKGKLGDMINAVLSAVGHNLRLILNYLRILFALIRIFLKTHYPTPKPLTDLKVF